jgi:hypothetical protein
MKYKLWRAANILMLLMFIFSVVVQYNDPDPVIWMVTYGLAASVCLQELFRPGGGWVLPGALGALTLVWGLALLGKVYGKVRFHALFEQFEMKGDLGVEIAREAGGLLIVAAWMLAIVIWRLRAQRQPEAPKPR